MDLAFLTTSPDAKNGESVEATEKHRDDKRKFAEESKEEELISSKRRCRGSSGTSLFTILYGQTEEDPISALPLESIHEHVRLAPRAMRQLYLKRLMQTKKLTLVLDLDETLINSTHFSDLSVEEIYLLYNMSTRKDEGLLQKVEFENDEYMLVKLRPYVRQFLREASSMFDMYVYTMGTRAYATEIVKLLDPENKYFAHKVITRLDCTEKGCKALDVVLGSKSSTIILDDLQYVWKEQDRENLIEMPPYDFFASSCRDSRDGCLREKSLAEKRMDENEADGVLASVFAKLKFAHEKFFELEQDNTSWGIPKVMKTYQLNDLKSNKPKISPLLLANLHGTDVK